MQRNATLFIPCSRILGKITVFGHFASQFCLSKRFILFFSNKHYFAILLDKIIEIFSG